MDGGRLLPIGGGVKGDGVSISSSSTACAPRPDSDRARPDRAGEWQVKVFTADGHGTTIDLVVDELAKVESVAAAPDHAHGYPGRVLAGLGYLLGLFGFWSLWRARRARSGAG